MQEEYSHEELHELFRDFLMEKFDGEEEVVRGYLFTVEDVIPKDLRQCFEPGFTSLYDILDESVIDDSRKKITADVMLRNMNRKADPSFTDTLRWYRQFVKSLKARTKPLVVPHGYESSNVEKNNAAETQFGTVSHNDSDYAPDTEGLQHQYNLTKKERNPELRRRCIAYYKSIWGGRIHCICCGFDFEKVYSDIGKDYIEIHHIEPHHKFEGEHEVDPTTKLIPLCSNCHSMIHRVEGQGECMTLEELKEKCKMRFLPIVTENELL